MIVFFVEPCKTHILHVTYIEKKYINQVSPVMLAIGSCNIFGVFAVLSLLENQYISNSKYDNYTHYTTLSWIQENLLSAYILMDGNTDLMEICRFSCLIISIKRRHKINLGFEIGIWFIKCVFSTSAYKMQ